MIQHLPQLYERCCYVFLTHINSAQNKCFASDTVPRERIHANSLNSRIEKPRVNRAAGNVLPNHVVDAPR